MESFGRANAAIGLVTASVIGIAMVAAGIYLIVHDKPFEIVEHPPHSPGTSPPKPKYMSVNTERKIGVVIILIAILIVGFSALSYYWTRKSKGYAQAMGSMAAIGDVSALLGKL